MPVELKPSDLKKNHLSIPRNPDIAHIVFLRGFIEKLGRGTVKMIDDCKENGFPSSGWKKSKGVTTLVFPDITVTGKFEDIAEGAHEGVIEGVIEGVTEGVKRKIITFILIIINDSGHRLPYYAEKLGESEKNLERYIKMIQNLVEFKGAPKSGGYYPVQELIEKIK